MPTLNTHHNASFCNLTKLQHRKTETIFAKLKSKSYNVKKQVFFLQTKYLTKMYSFELEFLHESVNFKTIFSLFIILLAFLSSMLSLSFSLFEKKSFRSHLHILIVSKKGLRLISVRICFGQSLC